MQTIQKLRIFYGTKSELASVERIDGHYAITRPGARRATIFLCRKGIRKFINQRVDDSGKINPEFALEAQE
jgi:hypothetical protein